MSEANIKAEAFLIVIKRILKWIGLSLLAIGFLIFMNYQYEQYKWREKKSIEDKVSIKAFHPKNNPCEKDFPYQYIIMNSSGKTVENVSFTVGIKRVGFSSEINRYTKINEDKIILNNEGYGRCFRAEDAIQYGKYLTEKDVEIVITYKDIAFESK